MHDFFEFNLDFGLILCLIGGVSVFSPLIKLIEEDGGDRRGWRV